jgi:dihydroorotate dehydrogenase electron transfer subunit
MEQQNVKVLWNDRLTPSCYKIGLRASDHFLAAIPGQFIMLRLGDQMDPLLRRPFSIHQLIIRDDVFKGIELLYKVVGAGTQKLAQLSPGDRVDILGPLGNGFFLPGNARQIFIVAGGIGVAPMLFWIAHLIGQNVDVSRCQVFLGGKSKADLLCVQDFSSLGIAVRTTTDDGTYGDQCQVTDPLGNEVARCRPDIIYACGPTEMLACAIGIAEKYGIACQVSIETMMACGIGACLGCAVERRNEADKYFHACLDGPVFDAAHIKI